MSFHEIKLPPFIITDLYSNVLIETEDNAKPKEEINTKKDAASSIKILGENRKNISIIVSDSTAVHLSDEKLELITKLLSACKLTLADVAIINNFNKSIVFKQIQEQLKPNYILLFGINEKQFELPLIFPEYRIQMHNNCQMLIASDLDKMIGNTDEVRMEKSKLWLSLKQMFGV